MALKGKKFTEEHRAKLSLAKLKNPSRFWLGKKRSEEDKLKMSVARKGTKPWNTGKTYTLGQRERIVIVCQFCDKKTEVTPFYRFRKFCSVKCGGLSRVGKPHQTTARGNKHYLWLEDRSQLKRFNDDRKDRRCPAYKEWRKRVFERDGFSCALRGEDCSGKIVAHHIIRWSDSKEKRFDLNNGITLCRFHHPTKRAEEDRLQQVLFDLLLGL